VIGVRQHLPRPLVSLSGQLIRPLLAIVRDLPRGTLRLADHAFSPIVGSLFERLKRF